MNAYHLLLWRPWQFDNGAIHNRTTNTYTFKVKGHNYTLTPLSLSQIQNIKPGLGEGNTCEKAQFLSETWL